MKPSLILTMFLTLAGRLMANDDLSCPFLWGTNYVGVLFEKTNLTVSTKNVIRDDVARILSFAQPENAVSEMLTPGSSYYGKWSGNMTLTNAVWPRLLPFGYYKTFSNTNYFVVEEGACSAYLDKIMLTNQNALAVGSLSNFLYTINNATTNTLAPSEFRALFWSVNEDRSITQDDFEAHGLDYSKAINELTALTNVNVSILDFEVGTVNTSSWVSVRIHVREKNQANGAWTEIPSVFREGQWRFIPGYEMP